MLHGVTPTLCYCDVRSHSLPDVNRSWALSNTICRFVSPSAWETADIDSNLRLYSFLSAFVVTLRLSHASWTEPTDRSISEKAFSDILQLPKFRELVSRRISVACRLRFQHHSSCRLFYITSFPILCSFIL
jgi:hypothetical protein